MSQPLLLELELRRPTDRQVDRGVEFIQARSILSKATGMLASQDFTINPYHGCRFGCSYCYAAFFEPDPKKVDRWGEWVQAKINALDLIKRARGVEGAKIVVGSATDPYQPIEADLNLTRSILEHLATRSPQPKIRLITRSPLVVRDIELLKSFNDFSMTLTITTDDDEVRKRYEPSCASIDRRFETLAKLAEAGIKVAVGTSPLLPLKNPKAFAERILDCGVTIAWCSYFHETRGQFASGTRPEAVRLARKDGWTEAEFRKTRDELKRWLPELR